MTECIFAAILFVVISQHTWTIFQYRQERKDLLTRLMARDLTEYQAAINTRPPPKSANPIRENIKRQYEVVK